VRTDHSRSDIGQAEIEEEPARNKTTCTRTQEMISHIDNMLEEEKERNNKR